MNRWALCLVLYSLSACSSSDIDIARNELSFLESNGGTPRELCAAAHKVTDAAMRAGDSSGYKSAQTQQQAICTSLQVFPQNADLPGGGPKATDEEINNQLAALNDSSAR